VLVVFVVEGQRYALALDAVERALPMVAVSPLPEAPPVALGVVNVHGRIVPVLDVRALSGLPARAAAASDRLLLVRRRAHTVAIPVDEVLGVERLPEGAVVAPDAVLPGMGRAAGVARLADGLLVIHDPETFLSVADERTLAQALSAGAP
jgi:purine-binding chemotaxis protein CheW